MLVAAVAVVISTVQDISVRGPVRSAHYASADDPIPGRRWLVLFTIAGTAIHHRVHGGGALFAGTIDLVVLTYGLAQLSHRAPRVRRDIYDQLAIPVSLACLLSSLALVAPAPGAIGQLVAVAAAYRQGPANRPWLTGALAAWLAWSAVAALLAVAPGADLTAAFATSAAAAAIWLAFARRDAMLPAALATLLAVGFGHADDLALGLTVLLASAACATAAVIVAATKLAPRSTPRIGMLEAPRRGRTPTSDPISLDARLRSLGLRSE